MRVISLSFLILMLFSQSFSQGEKRIVILHTNDLHSRLTGYAPESAYTPMSVNDDNTVGGFARIAAIIKNEKANNPGSTLVLDGGDFLMGTLFHALEVNTGFQLSLMKKMGYDAAGLGNHEFDFGTEKLAAIINSARENGEIPALLLGNAIFDSNDQKDDALVSLFSDSILSKKLVIERGGLKIGLFSIFGKVADHDAPYASPVKFARQTATARRLVRELKADKCDLIICVSHSGIDKNKKGEWDGEDVALARSVPGIDVIISGHTHTKLEQPLNINGVKIVQVGEHGQFVGRLELVFNDATLVSNNYRLIRVDDNIPGISDIHQSIENHKIKVNDEILAPLGFDFNKPLAETDFLLECNEQGDFKSSNLGPMVADAIHSYINRHNSKGTDIAIVAVGVIRDKIVPGVQTAPDIFRVMSLGSGSDDVPGYALARLFVTGKELKSIMEILQVAYKSTPANYCYYSGCRVLYDPDKGIFNKIRKIEIIQKDEGLVVVDFSKKNTTLYSITANSYMLEFIGIIKKMSFGLINVVPKDASGNPVKDMQKAVIDLDESLPGIQEGKEWLALMELIISMKDMNGNGIPEIDNKYSTAIQTFSTINP